VDVIVVSSWVSNQSYLLNHFKECSIFLVFSANWVLGVNVCSVFLSSYKMAKTETKPGFKAFLATISHKSPL